MRALPGGAPTRRVGSPAAIMRALPRIAWHGVFGTRVGLVLSHIMVADLSGKDTEEDDRGGPGACPPQRVSMPFSGPMCLNMPWIGCVVAAIAILHSFINGACDVVGVSFHLSRHIDVGLSDVFDDIRPVSRIGVVEVLAASSWFPLTWPRRRTLSSLSLALSLSLARKPPSCSTLSVRGAVAQQMSPAECDNGDPHQLLSGELADCASGSLCGLQQSAAGVPGNATDGRDSQGSVGQPEEDTKHLMSWGISEVRVHLCARVVSVVLWPAAVAAAVPLHLLPRHSAGAPEPSVDAVTGGYPEGAPWPAVVDMRHPKGVPRPIVVVHR